MTHDVETQRGVDFIPRLMDLDEQYHVRASFQVIPQKQYRIPYDLAKGVRERGFEFNIQDLDHDSNLFEDRERFLSSELDALPCLLS